MTENEQLNQQSNYGADSIKVLKGLDAVRKRPGMYIGDTDDGSGLHHMVYEVIDNSIDEALAGYCSLITVKIHHDGSVSVKDNGRGIPVDIHPEEKVSAAQVIMTVLHAGGKFDNNSYKVSGGLHGVGVSVVNALSDKLQLTIWRQGHIYQQTYINGGKPQTELKIIGDSEKTGTEIRFWPSPEIFSDLVFDYNVLSTRIRELTFLNSGVKICLQDERNEKKEEIFHNEDGIKGFVQFINDSIIEKRKQSDNPINIVNQKIVYVSKQTDGDITVEVAMQWNSSYDEKVLCFTNNIPQRDGGTHLSGFRSALTRVLKNYIDEQLKQGKLNNNKKDSNFLTSGEDSREGLTAVISVKVPDPKFSSQTKDKLVSSEVRMAVEQVLNEALTNYLEENPNDARAIVTKIIEAAKAREAARKAREKIRSDSTFRIGKIKKLANCIDKDPNNIELFIVEGDSAGGSAKQGRNREIQAILPLKGKILNVEKATSDRMLSSEEITNLIGAIGCGIKNDYNNDKVKYNKIIIMTDADVDGAHISVLILTFFFRQMPQLIENGHVYIAQPPLYLISIKNSKGNKNKFFVKDDSERDDRLITIAVEDANFYPSENSPALPKESLYTLVQNLVRTRNCMRRLVTNFNYPEKIVNNLLKVYPLTIEMFDNFESVNKWVNEFSNLYKNTVDFITLFDFEVSKIIDNETNKEKYYPKIIITDHGVKTEYILDEDLVNNPLYSFVPLDNSYFNNSDDSSNKFKYYSVTREYNEIVELIDDNTAYIERNKKKLKVSSFIEVVDFLMECAEKEVVIQRYKGLGEMNYDQLFETTMDPVNRVLKKVSINDAIEASNCFANFMGDDVSFRRNYIETHATEANLDY